uniref:Circumsporozoite protein n=1 Tax=Panagrellus redivivus TaxID=6233 RepID=A0A7E4ZQ01_PANRE
MSNFSGAPLLPTGGGETDHRESAIPPDVGVVPAAESSSAPAASSSEDDHYGTALKIATLMNGILGGVLSNPASSAQLTIQNGAMPRNTESVQTESTQTNELPTLTSPPVNENVRVSPEVFNILQSILALQASAVNQQPQPVASNPMPVGNPVQPDNANGMQPIPASQAPAVNQQPQPVASNPMPVYQQPQPGASNPMP